MKKNLYKIKAYHCPACGGVTEPTKRWCDWCGRSLELRQSGIYPHKVRILVGDEDEDNFIYWDSIYSLKIDRVVPDIIAARDAYGRLYRETHPAYHKFHLQIPLDRRSQEMLNNIHAGVKKTRIELLEGFGVSSAYECNSYIGDYITNFSQECMALSDIDIIEYGGGIQYNTAIPEKIVAEMRCPNCGAPIKSRYGACDYCSGWSAVEW